MTGLIFSPLGDRQTVRGQGILWIDQNFVAAKISFLSDPSENVIFTKKSIPISVPLY